MLDIRDARLRELAQIVMREAGAPSLTAAITRALEHEIESARKAVPPRERVAALRRRALEGAVRPAAPIGPDEIGQLWEP